MKGSEQQFSFAGIVINWYIYLSVCLSLWLSVCRIFLYRYIWIYLFRITRVYFTVALLFLLCLAEPSQVVWISEEYEDRRDY